MDNAQVTQADIDATQSVIDTWFNRSAIEIVFARHRQQAERDTLARHRLERSEPVGWMGIESAPKDGTIIDVWVDGEYPGRRTDVSWRKPTDSEWWVHGGDTIETLDATWHDSFGPLSGCEQPTHWMPLPSAPGTTTPEPVAEIERLREENGLLKALAVRIANGEGQSEGLRKYARAALGGAS